MILSSKEMDTIIDSIDYSRLGENVAIKTHFGEKGCTTYINPNYIKKIYEKIISLGKKATLIETNVLYRGARTKTEDHIKTAKEHGFDFAPIDILDGNMGENFIEVPVENGVIDKAKLGKGIQKYDSMIVVSHFKGHIAAGYGGVFKNIGMGIGSRGGKLHMHANINPFVREELCTSCGICKKNCDFNAIEITDKAKILPEKCIGCAMCIAVCPHGAVSIPWGTNTNEELQKRIIDYCDATFSLIPIKNCIFINVMEKITSECDCMGKSQHPMMEDIGIFAGYDPVELDSACLSIANEKSKGKFEQINNVNKNIQIEYAEKKGLGTSDFTVEQL